MKQSESVGEVGETECGRQSGAKGGRGVFKGVDVVEIMWNGYGWCDIGCKMRGWSDG